MLVPSTTNLSTAIDGIWRWAIASPVGGDAGTVVGAPAAVPGGVVVGAGAAAI